MSESTKFMVTNEQLYVVLGAPMLFNAVLIGLLWSTISSKFEGMNKRFDDMRDLWRSELNRAEKVVDARLEHLESR